MHDRTSPDSQEPLAKRPYDLPTRGAVTDGRGTRSSEREVRPTVTD